MASCSMSEKITRLRAAKEIAKSRGGKLLSLNYTNNRTKMLWRCSSDHEWEAPLCNIKNKNSWCKVCDNNSKSKRFRMHDGLLVAQKIASDKEGKCLSDVYINMHTKMLWECGDNHIWMATLNSIKYGNSWCLECSGKKKLCINVAIEIAEGRGGKCLSTKYISGKHLLKWKCENNHIWEATLNNVKNSNSWCKICGHLQGAKKLNNSCTLYHWKTGEELVCVASYEKAVIEYLNSNNINFKWQHKTFNMPNGKTYRPDLYMVGRRKPWIEIKGYMREKNRIKWEWFQTIKPNSELWGKSKLKEMGIL